MVCAEFQSWLTVTFMLCQVVSVAMLLFFQLYLCCLIMNEKPVLVTSEFRPEPVPELTSLTIQRSIQTCRCTKAIDIWGYHQNGTWFHFTAGPWFVFKTTARSRASAFQWPLSPVPNPGVVPRCQRGMSMSTGEAGMNRWIKHRPLIQNAEVWVLNETKGQLYLYPNLNSN